MKKSTNIIYYIATGLLSISFLFGAYGELMRTEQAAAIIVHLQYPLYLLTILGVSKILAVIGIWQKFSPTLREWAYAGITIDLIGAIASHVSVGDGPGLMGYGMALAHLIIVAASYITLKKREATRLVMTM